jgi:hypothetical protein
MDYSFFPSEVWMVERLMHYFFTTDTPLKDYVYDEAKLISLISDIRDQSNWEPSRNKFKKMFKLIAG